MSELWLSHDPDPSDTSDSDPLAGPVALCVALVSAAFIGAGFVLYLMGIPLGVLLLVAALGFSGFVLLDEMGSGLWRG